MPVRECCADKPRGDAGRRILNEPWREERLHGVLVESLRSVVGLVGWTGAVAAGASAGLAATGNLPDPIQQVVADVLEGVNIEVPAPDEEPVEDDPVDVDLVEEDSVPAVPAPDTDDSVNPSSGDSPGNSGDAPGNSGSAPGNSGDSPGNSGSAPGNSGNSNGRT